MKIPSTFWVLIRIGSVLVHSTFSVTAKQSYPVKVGVGGSGGSGTGAKAWRISDLAALAPAPSGAGEPFSIEPELT